jgi:hypothetical protein
MYHQYVVIAGLILGIIFILVGIFTIGQAEFFLATRETAINTRKDPAVGAKYGGLKLASLISKILGALVIVLGLAVIIVGFLAPV